jgi:hypothetical protein
VNQAPPVLETATASGDEPSGETVPRAAATPSEPAPAATQEPATTADPAATMPAQGTNDAERDAVLDQVNRAPTPLPTEPEALPAGPPPDTETRVDPTPQPLPPTPVPQSESAREATQGPASPPEPVSTAAPEQQDEAEREAQLDRVNQAPPVLDPAATAAPGPAPGGETQP